jgi:uncharacterized protein (DUF4415 family)
MKQTSTTKSTVIPDDEIQFTREHLKRAKYLVAGKEVTKAEWQKAAREQLAATLGKKRISIMLDGAIIAYFKAAAGERGYQTLINDALRKAIAGEQMVDEVRHAVREELATYKVTAKK